MSTTTGPGGARLLDDLERRGLRHDTTDPDALVERLDAGPTRLYCGFDPTADSLHLGNLQSIMLLRRFQLAGHAPIALVGGATGMIGDPGGRTEERVFLDADVLDHNRGEIGNQLQRFLDFDGGPTGALLVDNRSWTESMGVLEFLRDIGKHVTINTMLSRDSVRTRIEREAGISFTEFSYMLLQANDYLHLHLEHECDLQVAGSDQWGNIATGIDLVRRRTGDVVHGMTAPLILRPDGTKFGKSEGDNVWLSAQRTSPYAFYQFLLKVPDAEVGPLLARLTTIDADACDELVRRHSGAPHERLAQRTLARELTSLVHGDAVIPAIEAASDLLFGRGADLDEAAYELLGSEVPTTILPEADLVGADVVELLVRCGVASSKSEVRRSSKGYSINGTPLSERGVDEPVGADELRHGRFILLRRGKSAHHLVRRS